MNKILSVVLFVLILCGSVVSQSLPDLKLSDKPGNVKTDYQESSKKSFNEKDYSDLRNSQKNFYDETFQLKKRKTVNSYFGAGYSFIIFTDGDLSNIYPVLDTRSGAFLTNISLFFGFALSQVVAMEFEPAIMFASSSKNIVTNTGVPHFESADTMAYSSNMGLFSLPLSVNVRFFPMYKMKSFARLFFLGGGIGYQWIKEDYDVTYSRDPNLPPGYYGFGGRSETTSQWAPVFRVITGFTGTGGQFGFGGEVRYNIVPLKEEKGSPFMTRVAKNFNSVDIALRFYFSM